MSDAFKVGDKVNLIGPNIAPGVVAAIGSNAICVTWATGNIGMWQPHHLIKVADPPTPLLPACGYWRHGDVMLHNPVWRKCDANKDYHLSPHGYVTAPCSVTMPSLTGGEHRWCLSILREVLSQVKRWVGGVYCVTGQNHLGDHPLIDDGTGPHLDTDKIGREWAIAWLEKKAAEKPYLSFGTVLEYLRKEQEADK